MENSIHVFLLKINDLSIHLFIYLQLNKFWISAKFKYMDIYMFPAIYLCIYKITYDYNNFKYLNIYIFLVILTMYIYIFLLIYLCIYKITYDYNNHNICTYRLVLQYAVSRSKNGYSAEYIQQPCGDVLEVNNTIIMAIISITIPIINVCYNVQHVNYSDHYV